MNYTAPTQPRSKNTERKFLVALDELLRINGYVNTSIDDVAERAGLTRSAFLKRFGSKEQAVIVLFSKYCNQAMSQMQSFEDCLNEYPSLHFTLREMSQQFEAMLQMHMSANRAMQEHFQRNLEVHNLTKKIFKRSVDLMKAIQRRFLDADTCSDAGAWYAAQVLVTFDYNYLLRAMPAFPEDHHRRHSLIADFLEVALRKLRLTQRLSLQPS